MESALSKMGLYELLGGFVPGMTAIILWTYLELPPVAMGKIEGDNLKIVFFLVESYFIGLIIQELSSFIDKKMVNFRETSKRTFLNHDNNIVHDKKELNDYRKIANHILRKNADNTEFTPEDQHYVFMYCKGFLEANKKNGKEYSLDSLFAMSRSFTIMLPLLLIFRLLRCYVNSQFYVIDFFNLVLICFLTYVFYRRTKRYSFLRTHAVLQHYRALSQENVLHEDV